MHNYFQSIQTKLTEYYGLEFPESIFLLADFLNEYPTAELKGDLDSIGVFPSGILSLILNPNISTLKWKGVPVLHFRYYRDVPEFFTYLHGDTDGLHWGLLLDEPSDGFRGAASYYNNDGDEIEVYEGAFHALLDRCETQIEGYSELADYDNPNEETYYLEQQAKANRFRERIQVYIDKRSIAISEGRRESIPSNTGLGIHLPHKYFTENLNTTSSPEYWCQLVDESYSDLIESCTKGDLATAFQAGRSLWYWSSAKYSEKAYGLLRSVYVTLCREKLVSILDLHYKHRDMKNVGLVEGQ